MFIVKDMLTCPLIGLFVPKSLNVFVGVFVVLWIARTEEDITVHDLNPRTNIWITWANQPGQTDFCVSLAQVGDPFRTRLIGYPYIHWPDFEGYGPDISSLHRLYRQWQEAPSQEGTCRGSNTFFNDFNAYSLAQLINTLSISLPLPTQELEIWGSFPPVTGTRENLTAYTNCSNLHPDSQMGYTNGTGVVDFGPPMMVYLAKQGMRFYTNDQNLTGNSAHWNVSVNIGYHDANPIGGKKLPPGYFLICGDRAWPAIPRRPVGGPCYIGKLATFAPSMRQLLHHSRHRSTRALKDLSPDCDDRVNLGTVAGTVALSFFIPGAMAAANWRKIKNLACWAVKEFNTTSDILSGLATDVDSLRHAVLQNRAAIDFLLLAQGHGCAEFEGMCCMNLSDHSVSIHKQIATLKEMIHHVKEGTSSFDNWLRGLGLSGWLLDLCKQGFICLIAIFVCLMVLGCLFGRMKQMLLKTFNQTWLVQNKSGGIVETWLAEKGHIDMEQLDISGTRTTEM